MLKLDHQMKVIFTLPPKVVFIGRFIFCYNNSEYAAVARSCVCQRTPPYGTHVSARFV